MEIRKGTNFLQLIYTNWYIQFIHLMFFLLWEIAFNVVLLIFVLIAMKTKFSNFLNTELSTGIVLR